MKEWGRDERSEGGESGGLWQSKMWRAGSERDAYIVSTEEEREEQGPRCVCERGEGEGRSETAGEEKERLPCLAKGGRESGCKKNGALSPFAYSLAETHAVEARPTLLWPQTVGGRFKRVEGEGGGVCGKWLTPKVAL